MGRQADHRLADPPKVTPPIKCLQGIVHVTTLHVVCATNLELKHKSRRDHDKSSGVFVNVACGGQVVNTRVLPNTNAPAWDEVFEFYAVKQLPSPHRFAATGALRC